MSNETALLPANTGNPAPVVGNGTTMGSGSDRYPGTIIEVRRNGATVVVQSDAYKRVGEVNIYSEMQDYEFFTNVNGSTREYTRRADGHYLLKGQNFGYLTIGKRAAYLDPSF